MSKRPNVVVLFPDQLRAQSLPLFGETQIDTPHIDRLAGEGTLLTQAVSNCPVCTPARAMLLQRLDSHGHFAGPLQLTRSTAAIANSTRERNEGMKYEKCRICGFSSFEPSQVSITTLVTDV